MLLNIQLPYSNITGSHLLKREWAPYSMLLAGIDDVNNMRNGLLLYKPLEWAFDTSRLTFIWDAKRKKLVAHILDESIMDVALSSKAWELLKQRYRRDQRLLQGRRFRDVHGVALKLPTGFMPWRRALCFQAHHARMEAERRMWKSPGEFTFEDFWSEDDAYTPRVIAWLRDSEEQADSNTAASESIGQSSDDV
jgi:hypothetical protein